MGVAQHAVEFLHIVGVEPGAVVKRGLSGEEQGAIASLGRFHAKHPFIAEAADGGLDDGFANAVDEADMSGTGRAEVSFIREIGAFADIDGVHRLRYQPV